MKFKKSSCHCRECNALCEGSPCWPTPEEAKRLEAAHPDKVVWDTSYYADGWVRVMRPAAIGEKPGGTYKGFAGRCVFFQNDRCALHYTDLKPLEGRLSSHEHSSAQRDELRKYIGRMWRNHGI